MSDEELEYALRSAARWGRFQNVDAPEEARRLIDGGRFREAFVLLDAAAISPPREAFAWRSMEDAAAQLGLDERAVHYQHRYDVTHEERAAYMDGLFEQIESVVGSDCPVAEGMASVIGFCERAIPDWSWDIYRDPRRLEYACDLARLAERFARTFVEESPTDEIDGLWFGLFNPCYSGQESADMYVGGGVGAFEDPSAWAEDLVWTPRAGRARSRVLHAIHWAAYYGAEEDGWTPGLGNEAEHPLCLAYAALVVRWLATTPPTDVLIAGARERMIQVGFDSGDRLTIGTVNQDGLTFPPDGMI